MGLSRGRRGTRRSAAILVVATAVAGLALTCRAPTSSDTAAPAKAAPPSYVGRAACASCHEREHELWRGSHHDLAMQVADATTVLGDFDDASLTHFGVESTFFERDGKYFARTEGPDGGSADYEIAFTFGAYPLQQYLVAFPGGRYQVLGICWDSRPIEDGGQRWFHLYPGERIPPGDLLHWTGRNQNWNFMCAECHSTDLRRNYDAERDRYETTWAEIDVSCEACHGPGSAHVAWAQSAEEGEEPEGLVVGLGEAGSWVMDMESGVAERRPQRSSRTEIETCAPCHSRRSLLQDAYEHGKPLADGHRLALLDERLYHADGQIDEEVYVYGSFLQSKMHQAGVSCGDCHDPHSLELHGSGNSVCAGCHLASRFDTPEHHFHTAGTAGSFCVDCHMPVRTYMVVDPRRDHSFRIPRPDLSLSIETPNACNDCHTGQSPRWAAETVAEWYGPETSEKPHFGEALHAGRRNLAGARPALERLVGDETMPAIARATAFSLLPPHAGPETLPLVERGLGDRDPLVRAAALEVVAVVDPMARLRLAHALLADPIGSVRIRAARLLAGVPGGSMTSEQRVALNRALEEYRSVLKTNADRPESHLELGALHAERGELDESEAAYRAALKVDASFAPTYINLADLDRVRGREESGERHLRRALELAPDNGDAHHALGLLLVRRKKLDAAIEALARAAELAPEIPRYGYVLGVALTDAGQPERGLAVLEQTHARHPGDRDVLLALTTLLRDQQRLDSALTYARKLLDLSPRDPTVHQLLSQLESERPFYR